MSFCSKAVGKQKTKKQQIQLCEKKRLNENPLEFMLSHYKANGIVYNFYICTFETAASASLLLLKITVANDK